MNSDFDVDVSQPARCSVLDTRLVAALSRLRQGLEYARDLGQDVWDFAVEIQTLRADGLTNNDFRWLVCKGYVQHAGEVTVLGDDCRSFRRLGRLNFCRKTCFVLTEQGSAMLDRTGTAGVIATVITAAVRRPPGRLDPDGRADGVAARVCPEWDADRQELWLSGRIVKQFKVPAPNQEMVLAAFQEEGWPNRIDDPIPPHPDQDPKHRLHDTINSLNRNQKSRLLHFIGDGSGQGVRWEVDNRANGHVSGPSS